MAGPLPPAIGGMVSVISNLSESTLRDSYAIELFNTGKQTPEGRSVWSALTARFALWRQWWSALRSRPVIAHIHTCSGLSYFLDGALVVLARLRSVPVVLHIHGGSFDRFLDRLGAMQRTLARWIARLAARVVVVSPSWHDTLAPRLPRAHFAVVENGVPVPEASANRERLDPPVVLFLGGLSQVKGVEDLVRAAARLASPARIVLVGPEAEANFRERIEKLAIELNVRDRIELAGPATGERKSRFLMQSDVFVLPSHVEALPVAMLEAMAAGIAVVATTVGSIPSVVRNERNGLLVAPGDIEALARAIDRLLSDSALRERLAAQGREDCMQRYGLNRTAGALAALYAEVLDTDAGGRGRPRRVSHP